MQLTPRHNAPSRRELLRCCTQVPGASKPCRRQLEHVCSCREQAPLSPTGNRCPQSKNTANGEFLVYSMLRLFPSISVTVHVRDAALPGLLHHIQAAEHSSQTAYPWHFQPRLAGLSLEVSPCFHAPAQSPSHNLLWPLMPCRRDLHLRRRRIDVLTGVIQVLGKWE